MQSRVLRFSPFERVNFFQKHPNTVLILKGRVRGRVISPASTLLRTPHLFLHPPNLLRFIFSAQTKDFLKDFPFCYVLLLDSCVEIFETFVPLVRKSKRYSQKQQSIKRKHYEKNQKLLAHTSLKSLRLRNSDVHRL